MFDLLFEGVALFEALVLICVERVQRHREISCGGGVMWGVQTHFDILVQFVFRNLILYCKDFKTHTTPSQMGRPSLV